MKIHPIRACVLAALAVAAAHVPAHAADEGERARIASERAETEKRSASIGGRRLKLTRVPIML